MKAQEVYQGSNGVLTKAYYARLLACGSAGFVAMNLFRAQKASARAKVYRGRYKGLAYDKKGWSMAQLCDALAEHDDLGIGFGWKKDPAADHPNPWVLYCDLPEGQVSFHSPARYAGPDYPGDWDQASASEERILRFCDSVMAREFPRAANGAQQSLFGLAYG